MKRVKKGAQNKYLFIYMTWADLQAYDPDHCKSCSEALIQMRRDCHQIARHNGGKPEDIFVSCMDSLHDRIIWIWNTENWKEHIDDYE